LRNAWLSRFLEDDVGAGSEREPDCSVPSTRRQGFMAKGMKLY
jgi:hypothetical protein